MKVPWKEIWELPLGLWTRQEFLELKKLAIRTWNQDAPFQGFLDPDHRRRIRGWRSLTRALGTGADCLRDIVGKEYDVLPHGSTQDRREGPNDAGMIAFQQRCQLNSDSKTATTPTAQGTDHTERVCITSWNITSWTTLETAPGAEKERRVKKILTKRLLGLLETKWDSGHARACEHRHPHTLILDSPARETPAGGKNGGVALVVPTHLG